MNRHLLTPLIIALFLLLSGAGIFVFSTLRSLQADPQAFQELPKEFAEMERARAEALEAVATPELFPVGYDRGAAITASAISNAGTLAVFRQGGILHVFHPTTRTPDLRVRDAYASAADWHGETLYSVAGGPAPSFTRWTLAEGTLAPEGWTFTGEPKDLWLSADGKLAWILVRDQDQDAIVTVQLSDLRAPADAAPQDAANAAPALTEHMRTPIGAAPVGFFGGSAPSGLRSDSDTVLVPTFMGRQLVVFDAQTPVQPTILPLDIRPIFAVQGQANQRRMTIALAGNSPQLTSIIDGHPTLHDLPAPLSLALFTRSGIIGFSAERAELYRFGFDFAVEGVSEALPLITDLKLLENGQVLVVDAGPQPTLALLDPDTLDIIASAPVEGRPSRLHRYGHTISVVSPSEGTIGTWQLHP